MRKRIVFAALGASAAAAIAAGVVATGRSTPTSPGPPPGLARVSNAGSPVDSSALDAADRRTLETSGVTALRALGRTGGLAFFAATGPDGVTCYVTGAGGRAPRLGSVWCPAISTAEAFPSVSLPVLDLSTYAVDAETGTMRPVLLAGVAADGIAQVGIRDESGSTQWLPVRDNLFGSSRPALGTAAELVAVDASGATVYTRRLEPEP